jgi:hypothetical protein
MDTWVVPTSTKHISFRERAWGSAKPGENEIDDPSLIQMLAEPPRLTAGRLGAVPLGDKHTADACCQDVGWTTRPRQET